MIHRNKIRMSKASLGWLFKMAWRDGKASTKKLTLFMASIVLGIAAVVAIQSFGNNLKSNIAEQSKSLMGSDFKIGSNQPVNEVVQEIIDSLGGANAREIGFSSMAAFPKTGASRLVQVRGIESGFPFYGEMETEPVSAANTFHTRGGALVDITAMFQLNLRPGDSIKIGQITIPIIGELKSIPGSSSFFGAVAPPVIIPYDLIEATGLVQTGSRIGYDYYFVEPDNSKVDLLYGKIVKVLEAQEARLDTHTNASNRLGRRYDNFGKFLNLIAFIALLLGCLGIASAINIYIKQKLGSVAILKCLGASKKQTFLIYLIQIAIIGLVGGSIGTTLGLAIQQVFPFFLQDLLPVDVEIAISQQAVIMGLLLGVSMSVLFALYPLMSTIYTSPLQTLRVQETTSSKANRAGILVVIAIFLFIYLFSLWLLKDWRYAMVFVVGMLVTFSILTGTAAIFMKGIKNYFPHSWGFLARQSLLNLFRPQNQTLILVIAIGVGTFLISTLYFTKDVLLAQASIEGQSSSPNIILLDVQTEQKDAVINSISDQDLPLLDDIPIVTMRVNSINGKLVNEIRQDSTSKINRWILNHEFRTTYRDSLVASETLQEGKWTSSVTSTALIPISISDNFAEDAKVKIGDLIIFNVQGVLLNTVVGSIRTVDWSRMQPNFTIVFPMGVLNKAPQFRVLTTKAPNEKASANLQKELVQKFPNVSVLDLRQLLTVIEKLLDKISWIINFMAFFSIFTGIIVLLGAIRTSKHQRIRENVLLRTLGATSKQVLKITALEYIYLGILGSMAGIALSLLSSQLIAMWMFDTPFTPSWVPFLILFPGITLLVLAIGLGNSLAIIKSPPLAVLRKEGI